MAARNPQVPTKCLVAIVTGNRELVLGLTTASIEYFVDDTTGEEKQTRHIEAVLPGGTLERFVDKDNHSAALRGFEEKVGPRARAFLEKECHFEGEVSHTDDSVDHHAFIYTLNSSAVGGALGLKAELYESLSELMAIRCREEGLPALGELYGFTVVHLADLLPKELGPDGLYPLNDKIDLWQHYEHIAMKVAVFFNYAGQRAGIQRHPT